MKKTELVLGLLIVIFSVGLFALSRRTAEQTVPDHPQPAPQTVVASEVPLPSISFPPTNAAHTQPAPKPTQAPEPQAQNTPAPNTGNALQDPDARDALALVGEDPAADLYWLDAIFDTSLPDQEREDLMEDLNEVGFDDPKNITADDLPLIFNRLELIDDVLPSADDFMTEHLLEAQKDLINMLASASGPQQ